MTEITVIKPKQAKNKKYMLVSYGRMNTLGWFEHHEVNIPKLPCRVVVKTERGLELGRIVGQSCPYRAGQFRLSPEQTKKYFYDSEIDIVVEEAGKFIRYATPEDISEEKHLRKISEEELKCCQRFAKELGLPMKIVEAEHIFGGERLIFYFMSDGRVDFRDLVKKIAREQQTRIEMRQIGSRDEARLLGDIESCGQECCCIRFLKALKPVNMRMAKMQKATLDPSKISGYCGRLKCCLRYEDKTYTDLKRSLPRKNTIVKTKDGQGRVVDTQILTQLVMIEHADGTKTAVPVDELEEISSTPIEKEEQSDSANGEGRDDKEDTKQ
ncbi:MAG: regulatory iron-sulfur-containing complex subunit RicT [Phycisphaerae bacterium]|nr:regulatory iron-sulfur-containing complex subunit RicT [Phycisphaerae bacterium]MDD5380210.1 regulatory iron-sulfur-containing complex subunit RicT [Phycisphaerae bacterium]